METLKANTTRVTPGDRSKNLGIETINNLLDASTEALYKLDKYFNVSSDYCTMAMYLTLALSLTSTTMIKERI